MMPDLDVDTAVARAQERGEQTGRWVPENVIRQNYAVIPGNFLQLAGRADAAMLYDNRGEFPRLVWSQSGGGETEADPEFMDSFRQAHGPKPRRRESSSVFSDMMELLGEDDASEPAVSVVDITKATDQLKNAPKVDRDAKFSEDQGLVLPEPDDSALADVQ
jgi:hypothetical protein